jgi:hypothetical protein
MYQDIDLTNNVSLPLIFLEERQLEFVFVGVCKIQNGKNNLLGQRKEG